MRLSEWARIILLGNLVLFGLNPQTVDAQGWLTGPDVTSMGFGSGIGFTDGATDLDASIVYSPDGTMDFTFAVGKAWSTEASDFPDISLTQFAPGVTLHHFAGGFPVVASVSTWYSHGWLSSDVFDNLGLTVTGDT
jgi:hypothetical protein